MVKYKLISDLQIPTYTSQCEHVLCLKSAVVSDTEGYHTMNMRTAIFWDVLTECVGSIFRVWRQQVNPTTLTHINQRSLSYANRQQCSQPLLREGQTSQLQEMFKPQYCKPFFFNTISVKITGN